MKALAIIGDVHGAISPLRSALEWLDSNWLHSVVFVGDYINRGAHSYLVMEELVKLSKTINERLTLLIGNHEHSLHNFLYRDDRAAFLGHGGLQTVRSYLHELSIPLGENPVQTFKTNFPDSHKELLDSMVTSLESSDLLVTHAGFNPSDPFSRKPEDVVTGRHSSLFGSDLITPKSLVVCGHYVQRDQRPYVTDNFICLDSGCGTTPDGPLSVLLLPERQFLRFDGSTDG